MKKILIDTDIGSDCDDAGALALAFQLERNKEAEILAITHCASEIGGAVTIKAINEYYQRSELPVGRYTKKIYLEEDVCKCFTKHVMEEYLHTHEMPEFEDAVQVMRRVLAENQDVTLISIGTLNNYAELMKSGPDEISNLTGRELIEKYAKELYVMGGNFTDLSIAEYNIRTDIENARYVAEYFPVPVIYAGFELGVSVLTGKQLQQAENGNPAGKCYRIRQNGALRESWDPITVYCAIRSENPYYKKSEDCRISFDPQGRVILEKGGKDSYLIKSSTDEEVCQELERYMM